MKKIIVHCDETMNRKGEAVFIILFRVSQENGSPSTLLVTGVNILENVNAVACCQSLVEVFTTFSVEYKDIMADGITYMTSCVRTLKGLLSETLIHAQCWAHKLNGLAKIHANGLKKINECVAETKNAFLNTRKRKHDYVRYLRSKYPDGEKSAKLFPSPVVTRWGSWMTSALYIEEYLEDITGYIKELKSNSDSAALAYFNDLTPGKIKAIKCEATFVKEHCSSVVKLITNLEGANYPFAHKLYPKLHELLSEWPLIEKSILSDKVTNVLATLSDQRKETASSRMKQVAKKTVAKLQEQLKNDPAGKFFKSTAELFYLPSLLSNPVNSTFLDKVKNNAGLDGVSKSDFLSGYQVLQSLAKESAGGNSECDLVNSILTGMLEDHNSFTSKCLHSLWFSVSNVDSERGFPVYKDVLSDRQVGLSCANVETASSLFIQCHED